MDGSGASSGEAERTRSTDPHHYLLPLIFSGPVLPTGPAGLSRCRRRGTLGGLGARGSHCWGGSVSCLRVQKKAANREYSAAPMLPALPCLSRCRRQLFCLQTVSIICRASKNDVLNTARAEALNQINSFLIPQAFEFSALPKNC